MSRNQKYWSIAKLCDQHSHSLLRSSASPLTLCNMQTTYWYNGNALKLRRDFVYTRTEGSGLEPEVLQLRLVSIPGNKIITKLHKTANKIFCSDVKHSLKMNWTVGHFNIMVHYQLKTTKRSIRLHLHRNRILPEGANCSWLTDRLPALCELCVCVNEQALFVLC